jgi:hypothetical protein
MRFYGENALRFRLGDRLLMVFLPAGSAQRLFYRGQML